MDDHEKNYGVRYWFERWGRPPTEPTFDQVQRGIRTVGENIGYADDVFCASILRDDDGTITSILLLSSESMPPSKAILEAVRDQIIHQIEAHT